MLVSGKLLLGLFIQRKGQSDKQKYLEEKVSQKRLEFKDIQIQMMCNGTNTAGGQDFTSEIGWNRFVFTARIDDIESNTRVDFWAKKRDVDSFWDYNVMIIMFLAILVFVGMGVLMKNNLFIFVAGLAGVFFSYELVAFSMILSVLSVILSGLLLLQSILFGRKKNRWS